MATQTFDRKNSSALATQFLRLLYLLSVVGSYAALHYGNFGGAFISMKTENGNTVTAAASSPTVLVWDLLAIMLFIVLMLRNTNYTVTGIPGRFRRFSAFAIDFWFCLLALSGIGSMVPLWFEAARTGHFAWDFERHYRVGTDSAIDAIVIFTMALMILYFAYPLTRNRQTVGCFVMGIKTTPPFGSDGRFTLHAALRRVFYEFRGLCGAMSHGYQQDEFGRMWHDLETNCRVVLVEDR